MAALPDLSSIITPYQIKIQLGVDDTDIKDEKIKDSGAYDELLLDLSGWFPKFMELLNETTVTTEIQMQQIAIKTYGKYFICLKIALSGPLSFFQKIGDGENADSRFSIDWEDLIDNFEEQLAEAKAKALLIDTPLTPEKATLTGNSIMGVSVPSFDPVTQ